MSFIGYALRMAKKYYNLETYEHAIRVAGYISDNKMIPKDDMDICISLGIMHDLYEDTSYSENEIVPLELKFRLEILTKNEYESYTEYIQRISDNKAKYPEAYWVKIADIKDHLTQTKTLTNKLKEKYISGLAYLL